jgi:phosphoribosylformylglycinamidine (FGAM) synthase-like enzyme
MYKLQMKQQLHRSSHSIISLVEHSRYGSIVAKVVRELKEDDPPYFDLETTVTYERALRNTTSQVRSTLAVG